MTFVMGCVGGGYADVCDKYCVHEARAGNPVPPGLRSHTRVPMKALQMLCKTWNTSAGDGHKYSQRRALGLFKHKDGPAGHSSWVALNDRPAPTVLHETQFVTDSRNLSTVYLSKYG